MHGCCAAVLLTNSVEWRLLLVADALQIHGYVHVLSDVLVRKFYCQMHHIHTVMHVWWYIYCICSLCIRDLLNNLFGSKSSVMSKIYRRTCACVVHVGGENPGISPNVYYT